MTAVAIPGLLDTTQTDVDWELDLIFCQGNEALVEDWTGSDVSVTLWRTTAGQSSTLNLTSADGEGLLAPTAYVPVALRVPAASMHTLLAGNVSGRVRRIFPNGAVELSATFTLHLVAGLTTPAGEPGGLSGDHSAGGTVKVIKQIGSIRIVRAGGARGLSAKQIALDDEAEDLPPNASDAEFVTWLRKPAQDAADEVNDDVSGGLLAINETADQRIIDVNDAGNAQVLAVEEAGAEAAGDIADLKIAALAAIGEDNASGARGAAITAVDGAAVSGAGAVNAARDSAVTAIGPDNASGARGAAITAIGADNASGARGAAITAITGQQATSVGAVVTQQGTSVGIVAAEGAADVALVTSAGQAQLAAIALAALAANHVYSATTVTAAKAAAEADSGLAVNAYYMAVAGGLMTLYQKLAGPTSSAALFVLGSDADSVLRLRQALALFDSQVSEGLRNYPTMLPVRMFAGTLSGGAARNSDGTYLLPAGGGKWTSGSLNFEPFISAGTRYLYFGTVAPQSGALTFAVKHGGSTVASTLTQISSHYYRATWNNTVWTDSITLEIANPSGADVNLRPVEPYATDHPLLPQIIRYDDTVVVPEHRTVIDWDKISPMSRFGSTPLFFSAQQAQFTICYDSINGLAGNAGTAWAPKQDPATHGTAVNGEKIGLKSNSSWNGSLGGLIGAGNTAKGVMVLGYTDNDMYSPWAKLDGGRALDDRVWTAHTVPGMWYCDVVACQSTLITGDNYSFATVVAHKTADETALPLGCEFVLTPHNTLAQCEAGTSIYGDSWAEKPTSTTVRWYVKTPDGLKPGLGAYKYRGCTQYCPINFDAGSVRSATVGGVIGLQGCFGYGAYSGGPKNLTVGGVFAHGWTHTFKFEAGEARDIVLYGKGSTGNTGNCYIGFSANGYSWRWHNVIGFSCQTMLYSHNASGTYDHGEFSYCWAWNQRDPVTGSLVIGDAYNCDSVAKVLDEWNLTRGYETDGRTGTYAVPVDTEMRNKLILANGIFKPRKNTHDCVVVIENISGASVNDRNSVCIRIEQDFVVRNCLIYARNVDVSGGTLGLSDYQTTILDVVNNLGLNNPQVQKCFIVVETHLASNCILYNEASAGMVFTFNGCIVVICPPGNILSSKIGVGSKTTIDQALALFPTYFTNNTFDDRRDDPRKAAAVFMNPSRLDLRWAQTAVAAQHKAACIANDVGPWWTIKGEPTQYVTVDEAVYCLTRSHY